MPQQKLRVIISECHNPWLNLAAEEWIFEQVDPQTKILFLWRNEKTVVIGRFQNAWAECHVNAMEQDQVFLARRYSGGGAVYQDLGNTNFTLLSDRGEYSRQNNNKIILEALKSLGISRAEASGRNDLVIVDELGQRKFSGSAFKEKSDRALHHGTLLLGADLSKMPLYLNPDNKKLQSKGIKSVAARVVNLNTLNPEINHQNVSSTIVESFFNFYGQQVPVETFSESDFLRIDYIKKEFDKLSNWDWRYGKCPNFSQKLSERFNWGQVDLHFEVDQGLINTGQFFSDGLDAEILQRLSNALTGKRYQRSELSACLDELAEQLPRGQEIISDLKNWLMVNI